MGLNGVDNDTFKELMKKEKNICFLPGGFEEATICSYNRDRIFIKSRKGFIKYALQFGYNVYPCYTFNENKIYYTFNYLETFRLLLNKIKIPGCVFYGKFFVLPNSDVKLRTVIGKPLEFPTIANPTQEDIDKYHGLYIESIKNLFNKYRSDFNITEEMEIL